MFPSILLGILAAAAGACGMVLGICSGAAGERPSVWMLPAEYLQLWAFVFLALFGVLSFFSGMMA